MAWALKFDGVNDYMSFNDLVSTNINSNVSWDIEVLVKCTSGEVALPAGNSSANNGLIIRPDGNVDYRYNNGTTSTFSAAVADPTIYNKIRIEARWSGGDRNLTIFVNDVQGATNIISGISVAQINTSGRLLASNYFEAEVQYLKYTDNNNSANNRLYDSTSSSHIAGAVTWTDTSGNGEDATGSGFPTDGSAWLDLGGGGETLVVDSGSYSLNGTDLDLSVQSSITSQEGSYSLIGSNIGLLANLNITTTAGSYLLTGSHQNLIAAGQLLLESGSYDLTGTDVILIYTPAGVGEVLVVESGSYLLSGDEIILSADLSLVANSGDYQLAGSDTPVLFNGNINAEASSYLLTGTSLNTFANYGMIAQTASYTLTGTLVTLKWSGDTSQTIGTVTTGFADSLYSSGFQIDKYNSGFKPNTITVNFKG